MTYLDANVIIRLIERDVATRAALAARLQKVVDGFFTPELTLLERRCRPMKLADAATLNLYDQFFAAPEMQLLPLTRAVIDKATELRASTRLRTPDALHLAAALENNAGSFCTGDLHFKDISLISIEIL